MAIDAFKPDGPVADSRVQVLRRWKTTKPPFFLIPAASDNPAAFGIFGRIGLDGCLCLGKAVGGGQIEGEQLEPKAHDMAMRIDQSRQQRRAPPIKSEIELLGQLFLFGQQFGNFAVAPHHHRIETDNLAVLIERNAVYIFDQSISESRGSDGQQSEGA